MNNTILRFFAALFIAFSAVTVSTAQNITPSKFTDEKVTESANPEFPSIKIGNFGKMDDRFYRGAQPEKGDYASLAALGVKTVIDLRNDPTDYEKSEVEALGMKYVNIPMSGWKYADDQDVAKFMKLMEDPETGTVYVHCKAGKHRTGLVGAIYRFHKYGWTYDEAYKEMKKFNYTSWPVHFNIKSYVKDYSKQFEKSKAAASKEVAQMKTATVN